MAKARRPARSKSSSCSKSYPCALKLNGHPAMAGKIAIRVKTYSKYGTPEMVITGLPAGVTVRRVVTEPRRRAELDAMKARAGKAARAAVASKPARTAKPRRKAAR